MATAGDLVKGSLRLLSVLTRGETPAAEDTEEGLIALNDLVHEWYADNILIPSLTRESLTLVVGQSTYTIGTDGTPDFNTSRPLSIASIVLRDSGTDYTLDEISQRWWAQIPIKDTRVRPRMFYYEEGYPNGTIRFDSEPDSAYTIFVTSYKPFSDLASLATTVDLPPAYEKALRFNLAVDLAPEYGMEAPQTVLREAERARRAVVHRNMQNRPVELAVDYSLRGRGRSYDIRSDS